MCVSYPQSTDKLQLQYFQHQVTANRNKGWIAGYKKIQRRGTPCCQICSPIQWNKMGWVYALNSRNKKLSNKYRYTRKNNAGIHSYLNRNHSGIIIHKYSCMKIIKVWVHSDDIIAVDDFQMAARRVFYGTLKQAKEALVNDK